MKTKLHLVPIAELFAQPILAPHQKRLQPLKDGLASSDPRIRAAANRILGGAYRDLVNQLRASVAAALAIGLAILVVRTFRPYRRHKDKSLRKFENYCIGELKIPPSTAYYLSSAVEMWASIHTHEVQSSSLDALIALKRLTTDKLRLQAWSDAAIAAGGSPSRKDVEAAVSALLGEPDSPPAKSKIQLLAEEVLALIDANQINEAKARLLSEIPDVPQVVEETVNPLPLPVIDGGDQTADPIELDPVQPADELGIDVHPTHIIVRAPEVARSALKELGFAPADGNRLLATAGKFKDIGAEKFSEKIRETVAASLAAQNSKAA